MFPPFEARPCHPNDKQQRRDSNVQESLSPYFIRGDHQHREQGHDARRYDQSENRNLSVRLERTWNGIDNQQQYGRKNEKALVWRAENTDWVCE